MPALDDNDLFSNLRALAESAFPKYCRNCGREFETAEQFLFETKRINPQHSGLKQSRDDDGATIVEAYRNCVCGSTLMDCFSDRRNGTGANAARRESFGKLISQLQSHGWDEEVARSELLKIFRGERSILIEGLKGFKPAK